MHKKPVKNTKKNKNPESNSSNEQNKLKIGFSFQSFDLVPVAAFQTGNSGIFNFSLPVNFENSNTLGSSLLPQNRDPETIQNSDPETIQNSDLKTISENSTASPQLDTQHQNLVMDNPPGHTCDYKSYKFKGANNFFTKVLISKMSEKWELAKASNPIIFTADESYGIMLTDVGLLINHLVKKNGAKLKSGSESSLTPETTTRVNKSRIGNTGTALSKPVKRSGGRILKKLNDLSYNNGLETIWVQGIEEGGIAYANQRHNLYRIYLLGNGKLVELAGETAAAIVDLPKKNKFLIMISARAANAVKFAADSKGNSDEQLFNIIWDNIDKQIEETPELIIASIQDN